LTSRVFKKQQYLFLCLFNDFISTFFFFCTSRIDNTAYPALHLFLRLKSSEMLLCSRLVKSHKVSEESQCLHFQGQTDQSNTMLLPPNVGECLTSPNYVTSHKIWTCSKPAVRSSHLKSIFSLDVPCLFAFLQFDPLFLLLANTAN
jgi:hypothetical protein